MSFHSLHGRVRRDPRVIIPVLSQTSSLLNLKTSPPEFYRRAPEQDHRPSFPANDSDELAHLLNERSGCMGAMQPVPEVQ